MEDVKLNVVKGFLPLKFLKSKVVRINCAQKWSRFKNVLHGLKIWQRYASLGQSMHRLWVDAQKLKHLTK
jgi:hypothetical protein